MRKYALAVLLVMLSTFVLLRSGQACTTYDLQQGEEHFVGRNYDWSVGDGLVIINKRGMSKTAMTIENETGTPANWKARFGSITFNQFGREFPQGGMNEAGLVVETMMVPNTEFPSSDGRPYLNSMQWRQYQLDNCGTVDEVIATDSRIRISGVGKAPGVHFLVSDKAGNCAVIEFFNGKTMIHSGETMPVRVLSNGAYAECLEYWRKETLPVFDQYRSVYRFTKAAEMVSTASLAASPATIDYSFEILEKVVQEGKTKWSIVYDLCHLRVLFRTSAHPKICHIDLGRIDFSCRSPVKVLDMDGDWSGDVTANFQEYSLQANRNLIEKAFKGTEILKGVPNAVLDKRARYPESASCD